MLGVLINMPFFPCLLFTPVDNINQDFLDCLVYNDLSCLVLPSCEHPYVPPFHYIWPPGNVVHTLGFFGTHFCFILTISIWRRMIYQCKELINDRFILFLPVV